MNGAPRSGCPINLTLELLGDRWSLIVVRDILFGNRRHFREMLTRSEEGIASNILTDRLSRLVEAGMLSRAADPSHRQKGDLQPHRTGNPARAVACPYGRLGMPPHAGHSRALGAGAIARGRRARHVGGIHGRASQHPSGLPDEGAVGHRKAAGRLRTHGRRRPAGAERGGASRQSKSARQQPPGIGNTSDRGDAVMGRSDAGPAMFGAEDVDYLRLDDLGPDVFVDILRRSGLAPRRPIGDGPRISRMVRNASLVGRGAGPAIFRICGNCAGAYGFCLLLLCVRSRGRPALSAPRHRDGVAGAHQDSCRARGVVPAGLRAASAELLRSHRYARGRGSLPVRSGTLTWRRTALPGFEHGRVGRVEPGWRPLAEEYSIIPSKDLLVKSTPYRPEKCTTKKDNV